MKKAYYLKTCDTCKRIIKSLPNTDGMILQDIKENPITVKELEELYKLSGSYEKLFSKRAKLYKERGLKDEKLSEQDFKQFILEHYTFLNRPVFVVDDKIFIGNNSKTIEELIEELSK
jgi:arsenate reductase-like glutaredoxin family protein